MQIEKPFKKCTFQNACPHSWSWVLAFWVCLQSGIWVLSLGLSPVLFLSFVFWVCLQSWCRVFGSWVWFQYWFVSFGLGVCLQSWFWVEFGVWVCLQSWSWVLAFWVCVQSWFWVFVCLWFPHFPVIFHLICPFGFLTLGLWPGGMTWRLHFLGWSHVISLGFLDSKFMEQG